MRQVTVVLSLFVLFGMAVANVAAEESDSDRCMPLSSITSLTFRQGMTTGRSRTPNVPTLTCMGNCPSNAFLEGAQCQQTGMSDNGLPSWKCLGSFPASTVKESFSLGNIRVQCEGCTKAQDPNVAKGSCALTYSVRTSGRRSIGHSARYSRRGSMEDGLWADFFLTLLFVGIISLMCICACRRRGGPRSRGDPNTTTTVHEGVPLDQYGNPTGKPGTVHHHHYGGNGGGGNGSGFGGFGTGMFTGFLMGDMLGRMSAPGYGTMGYGGGYGGGDDYAGGGGFEDTGFSGGDGGFGGTDSI